VIFESDFDNGYDFKNHWTSTENRCWSPFPQSGHLHRRKILLTDPFPYLSLTCCVKQSLSNSHERDYRWWERTGLISPQSSRVTWIIGRRSISISLRKILASTWARPAISMHSSSAPSQWTAMKVFAHCSFVAKSERIVSPSADAGQRRVSCWSH
jgi:hypothetical protein